MCWAPRGSIGGARSRSELAIGLATLTSINIGVEETQDELEVRLLAGYERHDGQLVSRRVSPSCVVDGVLRLSWENLGGGERFLLVGCNVGTRAAVTCIILLVEPMQPDTVKDSSFELCNLSVGPCLVSSKTPENDGCCQYPVLVSRQLGRACGEHRPNIHLSTKLRD